MTVSKQPAKQRNYRKCIDCGISTRRIHEYYMVYGSVWDLTGLDYSAGELCIGCLELRIGRELVSADFINCGANFSDKRSERLRQRQGAFFDDLSNEDTTWLSAHRTSQFGGLQ